MQHLSIAAASRRLPRRSPRQRLTAVGIALAISAVFWAAIWFARHDVDPLLYERIVPVKIIPSHEDHPSSPARAASAIARH